VALAARSGEARPLEAISDADLRLLARQHAFGGVARFESAPDAATEAGARWHGDASAPLTATRHHAIDWNYVGAPRTRPNKWRVRPTAASARHELDERVTGAVTGAVAGESRVDDWQELSFALDDGGRAYYHERWHRHEGGEGAPVLSMRLRRPKAEGADGLLVVVGDHFAYLVNRPISPAEMAPLGPSLAAVVDGAIERGDRALAEAALLLHAGHGRVSNGWAVDKSLQPWHEGTSLDDLFATLRAVDASRAPDGAGATLAQALSAHGERVEAVQVGGAVFDVHERAV
jgi:hypothetical protein